MVDEVIFLRCSCLSGGQTSAEFAFVHSIGKVRHLSGDFLRVHAADSVRDPAARPAALADKLFLHA